MQPSTSFDSSSKLSSKKNFVKQQQKIDKNNNINHNVVNHHQNSSPTSGVATSFLYKLSELVATVSYTYNNFTTTGGVTGPEPSSSRKRRDYDNGGDVMQINADDSDGAYDDEMSDVEMDYNSDETNKKLDRKDEVKWSVNNDDDEEPPPPYEPSWVMPKTTNSEANNTTTNSPKQKSFASQNPEGKSASSSKETTTISQSIPRRRQIRVRRPRRLLRRKSTESSTPKSGGGKYDNPDELLLKVNDKLSDMIAQGRAALTSTVNITEVDMLLAEENDREEKIMKELGLQTPVGRKGRKHTTTTDYDYFTSLSDGNYSPTEASQFEYAYNNNNTYSRHGSGYGSPSGYATPPTSYNSHGHGHYNNTPSQYNSPYHQSQNGLNFSNLGFSLNNNNNNNNNHNGRYASENDFIPNRYYSSPSGFNEPSIPKGFGAGPISARLGARFGPNNNGGFGTNYVPSFAGSSNTGGYGFGPNSGYGTNGMYNTNNRGFMC